MAPSGSSWLVRQRDTKSIDASAIPVISPAACRYSTLPRASRCSSLVRRKYRPTASMCGERSTPVIRAEGNVCASFMVESPVEQPMSRMSFGSGPYTGIYIYTCNAYIMYIMYMMYTMNIMYNGI